MDALTFCPHPTASVRYYSEIDEEGRLYEEYLCLECNCWLPPDFTDGYHRRPDWVEDIPIED